mmetsp:Transcript_33809/g.76532  ORF Transcript_33809/g.76532 Transcript_33809/m.76532 type:complete len:261 (+) Transcript_33809:343-1125(+)
MPHGSWTQQPSSPQGPPSAGTKHQGPLPAHRDTRSRPRSIRSLRRKRNADRRPALRWSCSEACPISRRRNGSCAACPRTPTPDGSNHKSRASRATSPRYNSPASPATPTLARASAEELPTITPQPPTKTVWPTRRSPRPPAVQNSSVWPLAHDGASSAHVGWPRRSHGCAREGRDGPCHSPTRNTARRSAGGKSLRRPERRPRTTARATTSASRTFRGLLASDSPRPTEPKRRPGWPASHGRSCRWRRPAALGRPACRAQ